MPSSTDLIGLGHQNGSLPTAGQRGAGGPLEQHQSYENQAQCADDAGQSRGQHKLPKRRHASTPTTILAAAKVARLPAVVDSGAVAAVNLTASDDLYPEESSTEGQHGQPMGEHGHG